MFKQLCKHYVFRQPIFTWKTYNHAVTYNHGSADGNLRYFGHFLKKIVFKIMIILKIVLMVSLINKFMACFLKQATKKTTTF